MKLQNSSLWSARPWLHTGAIWRESSPAAQPGPETLSQPGRRGPGPCLGAGGQGAANGGAVLRPTRGCGQTPAGRGGTLLSSRRFSPETCEPDGRSSSRNGKRWRVLLLLVCSGPWSFQMRASFGLFLQSKPSALCLGQRLALSGVSAAGGSVQPRPRRQLRHPQGRGHGPTASSVPARPARRLCPRVSCRTVARDTLTRRATALWSSPDQRPASGTEAPGCPHGHQPCRQRQHRGVTGSPHR